MIMDVKSAFLYGKVKRTVYIELPKEDPRSRKGDTLGKLIKAMYGTRDAPQIWQEVVKEKMKKLGFLVSMLHPSVYYHPIRKVYILAHVDDFLCLGPDEHLEWFLSGINKRVHSVQNNFELRPE